MYEVELKFRLPDPSAAIDCLSSWNARRDEPVDQTDTYFRHPARDFAQTDEALRLRSVGQRNWLTYKGPVIDRRTKTRREIETPLGDGPAMAGEFAEILSALGFEPVRTVRKRRAVWHLTREGRDIEVSLDDVAGLGTYLEVETLAADAQRAAAQQAILAVAAGIGLYEAERRSYLELLLEEDSKKM